MKSAWAIASGGAAWLALSAACGEQFTSGPGGGGPGQGGSAAAAAAGGATSGGGGGAGGGALPDGAPCVEGGQCVSTFCTDGYCCADECAGPCRSCAEDGREGVCTPLEQGTVDPDCEGICDSGGRCATGSALWAVSLGDEAMQDVADVAADGDGNGIVVGTYRGTLVGSELPAASVAGDGFVVSFGSDGTVRWATRIAAVGGVELHAVAVDANGSVWAVGNYRGQATVGSLTLPDAATSRNALVVKLGGDDGDIQCAAGLGQIGSDQRLLAAASTGAAGVVAAGSYQGTPSFREGNALPDGGMAGSGVVVRIGDGCEVSWAVPFVASAGAVATGVTSGAGGNVLAVGTFNTSLSLTTTVELASAGGTDSFLVELDASGALQWHRQIGSELNQEATAVAQQPNGWAIVVGWFRGNLGIGGVPPATLHRDVFVAGFDVGGTQEWAESYTGTGNAEAWGVACDAAGDLYVTGTHEGGLDFGGGGLVGLGITDAFVAKLAANRTLLWNHTFGDGLAQRGEAVAVAPSGHAYWVAQHEGEVEVIDGIPLDGGLAGNVLAAYFAP